MKKKKNSGRKSGYQAYYLLTCLGGFWNWKKWKGKMWQAFNDMTGGLRGRNVLPSVHPEASLMLNSSYHLYDGWCKVSAKLVSDFYFFHMKKTILWIWLQSFYYFELVPTSCKVNYFKDHHWFDTCEVLFASRPTEVVSKVINASISQIRSWCVMTQWSAVRIYSLLLMRMNLFSRSLAKTRRLKDHKCTCCFSALQWVV